MDSFKLCAAACLAAVTVVLVRQSRADVALPVRAAANVVLLGGGLAGLTPTLRYLDALGSRAFGGDAAILVRALAVVFLVRICAGLCRDLGEPTVAAALEFAGRAELLLLAVPLIDRLLEAATRLAAW